MLQIGAGLFRIGIGEGRLGHGDRDRHYATGGWGSCDDDFSSNSTSNGSNKFKIEYEISTLLGRVSWVLAAKW